MFKYDTIPKTQSRIMTAIAFSRQKARTILVLKIPVVVVFVYEINMATFLSLQSCKDKNQYFAIYIIRQTVYLFSLNGKYNS